MSTFSYTWSTGTMTESDGIVSVAIPLEGTVEGFGPVFGTLHSHNIGKPTGTFDFIAVSFPESGDQVTAVGTGEWTQVAPDRWTTVGSTDLSTGQTVKGEGIFSLTERSWSGTFS
jgi:hypothetical protein